MAGGGAEGRRVRVALACSYGGLFFSLGIYMPFFPLWLTARGLEPQEIGFALAVPLITRLIATPLLGVLSDRLGRPKAVLALLAVLTLALVVLLANAHAALAIFLILGIAATVWNPSYALLDAYATRQARAGRVDYGRSRLWGSAAFVAANLLGGAVIARSGASIVVLLMLAGHAAFLVCLAFLPELPRAIPPAHGARLHRARLVLVLGILAAALVQASHGALYAFASLHWTANGLSTGAIGVLWAVGVVAEIVLFRFGTRLARRLGPLALLAAGGLCAGVRFTALMFDLPFELLLPVQLLHGGTFGATYLGMVELVARYAPESRAASAQSVAAWTVSLALSAASAASGPLWALYDARTFLLSAGLGLLGALTAGAAMLAQPQRSGAGGQTRVPS